MARSSIKPLQDSDRSWYLFDAREYILGRLASQIATLLRGKHKAIYSPQWDQGDFVVVINCSRLQVTGNKLQGKIYYHHSGYPGGLKQEKLQDLLKRRPTEVLRKAVIGMLPKNRLRQQIIKKLFLFEGDKHTFTDKKFANA